MDTDKFCPRCERTLPLANFYKSKNRKNKIRASCSDCDRVIRKHRTRNLREKVYDLLGRACVRCGFSDRRALQIDHVFGGGNQEHANIPNPDKFTRKVLEDTSGSYQILCANCNWIKRFERVEISHPPMFTIEQEAKILQSNAGKPVTEGTKARLSAAGKGKVVWNVGIPAWNRGVPRSPELKEKLSLLAKAIHAKRTPEERSAIAQKREDARTFEQKSEQRKKAAKSRRESLLLAA